MLSILEIDHGSRGDLTILDTLIVNNKQYRGVASIVLSNFSYTYLYVNWKKVMC
jgi:hypothetical protein